MPRYYFHLRRPEGLDRDDTGLDFPGVEAAYLGAFDAILTMTVDLTRRKENPRRFAFEIADETGATLFDIPFAEFLDRGRRPVVPLRRAAAVEMARTTELIAAIERERAALAATLTETQRLLAQARRAGSPPPDRPDPPSPRHGAGASAPSGIAHGSPCGRGARRARRSATARARP